MGIATWINLAGLSLGFVGVIFTLTGAFLTKEQAVQLGLARWPSDKAEENLKLPLVQEMLRQARRSKFGLGLIALGFVLQGIATVWSNVK